MIRKLFIWIILVLFIAIVIIGYFALKRKNIEVANIMEAIPVDASLIITSHDPQKDIRTILEENDMWDELISFSSIKHLNNQLLKIDSTIRTNPQVNDIYRRQNINLSFHQSGKNKFDYIVYIPLFHFNNERHISLFIEQEAGMKGIITQRKYSGTKIYDVRSAENILYNFSGLIHSKSLRDPG